MTKLLISGGLRCPRTGDVCHCPEGPQLVTGEGRVEDDADGRLNYVGPIGTFIESHVVVECGDADSSISDGVAWV